MQQLHIDQKKTIFIDYDAKTSLGIQFKNYFLMPLWAAAFPASPALPSSISTSSALLSSVTSLARIFPPWKHKNEIQSSWLTKTGNETNTFPVPNPNQLDC